MSGEIVKYNNQLNNVSLRGFKEIEISLFFAICAKVKGAENNVVELDFDYLKSITKQKNHIGNEQYARILDEMAEKLQKLSFVYVDDHSITRGTLFPIFQSDWADKTLKVKVSEEFEFLFNQLSKEFTRFELDEFLRAKGIYAKQLYRLLKQYRMTGNYIRFWETTEDNIGFRDLMSVPEGYKNKEVTRRVIDPAVEELRKFKGFQDLKYDYELRGRKVYKVIFTWTPEERSTEQPQRKSTIRMPVPEYIQQQKDGTLPEPKKASPELIQKIKDMQIERDERKADEIKVEDLFNWDI